MENKDTTYYSLRYGMTDSLHKKGETVVIPSGEVRIGQQEDCKIQLANDTEFEDELYAIIRPSRNAGEWQLIPASEHVRTFVNGNAVLLVHYLSDGDRISFEQEEQEFLFNVHHDGKVAASQGIQYIAAPISRKLIALLIAVPLILFSALYYIINTNNKKEERKIEILNTLRASVLQISVDTVRYVMVTKDGEQVLQTYSYLADEGYVINGTAFLTNDNRIVTARHCIEPWLNDADIQSAMLPSDLKSTPTRWAMIAETKNQCRLNSDTIYKVVAYCNFYRGNNGTEPFGRTYRSSEFHYDTSRDAIVEKGDFEHEYYWRSITETYSNKEMIFDDVAWAKTDSTGKIAVATQKEITELLTSKCDLNFIGYPDHKTMRGLNIGEGKLELDYAQGSMIAHSGNLIHGYSGAPVLVLKDDKAYAVGVVSRLDANGGGRSYSVPINELKKEGGPK